MHFLRVFVHVLFCRCGGDTLHFRLMFRLCLRRKNLLAAIHARRLINVVRETEVAALFVLYDIGCHKRVVGPAIAGVSARMAHSD